MNKAIKKIIIAIVALLVAVLSVFASSYAIFNRLVDANRLISVNTGNWSNFAEEFIYENNDDLHILQVGNGYEYYNCVTITGYVGRKTSVVFPSVVYDKNDGNKLKFVTKIGENAFSKSNHIEGTNKNITSMTFRKTDNYDYALTEIMPYAFRTSDIKDFSTLPTSVQSIGREAFAESMVEMINLEDVSVIGEKAFMSSALKHTAESVLILPNQIKEIGNFAFADCDNLQKVYVGDSTFSIGTGAFSYSNNLQEISVSNINTHYKSFNGVLYTNDYNMKLLQYPIGLKNNTFNFPKDVACVASHSFAESLLTTISFSNSKITTIEDDAFRLSKNIADINVGKSIEYIGAGAFAECVSLKSVYIDNSAKTPAKLGTEAFGTGVGIVINVPQNLYSTYTANADWNKYQIILN